MRFFFSRYRLIIIILWISLLPLGSWACGKKGPPVPPESTFPAAVSDLRAWPREGVVLLGWSLPARNSDGSRLEDLLGFKVLRQERPLSPASCPNCPSDFKVVAEIDVDYPRNARVEGGRVLWPDGAVKPQHEYTYAVVAYNSYKSASEESNRVKITWDDPPSAPAEVHLKAGDRALEVTWSFQPRLLSGKETTEPFGFNLYRRGEGERFGFYPVNPEPLSQPRFVDGGLVNGKRYYYEVRAVRNIRGTFIEGPASPLAEGIPEKLTPPSPPTGLTAVFQKEGVVLRWKENPEPDIGGYDLFRREAEEKTFRKINSSLIKEPYYLDESADPQKSYSYRLKALSTSGRESEFSQDVEISPEPPSPQK